MSPVEHTIQMQALFVPDDQIVSFLMRDIMMRVHTIRSEPMKRSKIFLNTIGQKKYQKLFPIHGMDLWGIHKPDCVI